VFTELPTSFLLLAVTHILDSIRVVPDSVTLVNKCLVMWTGKFAARLPAGAEGVLSSAQRIDPLRGPCSSLFKGYRGSYTGGRFVNLTTYLHPVPRLRMNGVTLLLPYVICAGTNYPFLLYYKF
jgi:hypothetical protein